MATQSAVVFEVLKHDNYHKWSAFVKSYLSAENLWDIIEPTAEPPIPKNCDAEFEARKDMALHAIQISCGPQLRSLFKTKITSARAGWHVLASEHKLYEPSIDKTAVFEVLREDNFDSWSACMQSHMMAHDVWDIIEAAAEPPNQGNCDAKFKAWSKRNAMALQAIKMSCDPRLLSKIRNITSAKIAWDTLATMHKRNEIPEENTPFEKASQEPEVKKGHQIIDETPDEFASDIEEYETSDEEASYDEDEKEMAYAEDFDNFTKVKPRKRRKQRANSNHGKRRPVRNIGKPHKYLS